MSIKAKVGMKIIPAVPEIDKALQEYATSHGRTWKNDLRRDWSRCQPAGILISLRNSSLGFDYLDQSKIKPKN
jgi:hypothetical protein